MEILTKKQGEILDFIKVYVANHGYPPTVREIAKKLKVNSPATIHSHLNKLVEKKYIKKDDSKNRAIELLVDNEYLNKNESIVSIPLLGKIKAGLPIEAIENPNDFFDVPSYLIPKNKEVYALNVSGDSMINVGIYDNDIVLIEKQNIARNGDIVVAMNDENEVTLKTFYKEKGYFRLQPENDTMEPIILNNVTILGKAIGLYRKL
ncbi:MAG: transcriptional repressor LexA [Tenericutes bacterium]|nr:transcriptional repressor LexA [Mycoplasmatota bacterium]